ncbi:unnamed protein product [Amoebophrya sp. A25]|nr:unnamed protein product [Amoebophrya sp. A25]|eukprot:GSA25T00021755001.1
MPGESHRYCERRDPTLPIPESRSLPCGCYAARFFGDCQGCRQAKIWEGDCITSCGNRAWRHTACSAMGGGRDRDIEGRMVAVARSQEEIIGSIGKLEKRQIKKALALTNDATHPSLGAGATASSPSTSGRPRKTSDMDYSIVQHVPFRSDDTKYTQEQEKFLHYTMRAGQVARVIARAGCGKTTMAAAYCKRFLQLRPGSKILYIVFNKKNAEEAKQSKKFDNEQVDIFTSHSFAYRRLFRIFNTRNSDNPDPWKTKALCGIWDIFRDKVERNEGGVLSAQQRATFLERSAKGQKLLGRTVRTICNLIAGTVAKFCQSERATITNDDVPLRAIPDPDTLDQKKSAKWKLLLDPEFYVAHAKKVWQKMEQEIRGGMNEPPARGDPQRDVGVGHDNYLKFWQLQRPDLGLLGYALIIVDECQDMTRCQSQFFAHQPTTRVLLLGDTSQRIYGWRGASDSFESVRAQDFRLTISFRFGKEIATLATKFLRVADPNALVIGRGIPTRPVSILPAEENLLEAHDGRFVLLVRSNKQIIKELLGMRAELGRFPRWQFASTSMRLPDSKTVEKFAKFYCETKEGGEANDRRDRDFFTSSQPHHRNSQHSASSSQSPHKFHQNYRNLSESQEPLFATQNSAPSSSQPYDRHYKNSHHDLQLVNIGSRPPGVRIAAPNYLDTMIATLRSGRSQSSSGMRQSRAAGAPVGLVSHDNEEFEEWDDLKNHCADNEDIKTLSVLLLIEDLGSQVALHLRSVVAAKVENDDWEVRIGTVHAVKGCEYRETVVIADDFPLPVYNKNHVRAGEIKDKADLKFSDIEAINLLYVAVTRAMGNLRLRSKVWDFLQDIDEKKRQEKEEQRRQHERFGSACGGGSYSQYAHGPGGGPDSDSSEDEEVDSSQDAEERGMWLQAEWDRLQAEWQIFAARKAELSPAEQLKQIPWPVDFDNPCSLSRDTAPSAMEEATRRVKFCLLHYHSDKWETTLAAAASDGSAGRSQPARFFAGVRSKLNQITQAAAEKKKHLRLNGDEEQGESEEQAPGAPTSGHGDRSTGRHQSGGPEMKRRRCS